MKEADQATLLRRLRGEYTDLEAQAVLDWAEEVERRYQLLQAILSGYVLVEITDGRPDFQLSKLGKAVSKTLDI